MLCVDKVSDPPQKVKWQEAKIQYLQMKLKEKENVSNQLESMKQVGFFLCRFVLICIYVSSTTVKRLHSSKMMSI